MPRRTLVVLVATGALALPACGGDDDSGTAPARTQTAEAKPKPKPKPKPKRIADLTPPANAPSRSVEVPVLTWHRVNPLRPGANAIETDLTVDPVVFAASIQALKKAGYNSITQEQLFNALYKDTKLPPKPVLLTVDDGYVDALRTILPVLERANMVATFYIITERFDEGGFLTQAQVRQLDKAGMDIGNHSHTHTDLTALDPLALKREVEGANAELEDVLGHEVYTFCYPSGRHSPAVEQAVKDAGLTFAYTTEGGTTMSTDRRVALPRLHIGRSMTPESLLQLLPA